MKERILIHPGLKSSNPEVTEPQLMQEVHDLRARFGIDKIMGASSMLDLIQKEMKLHPHAMAS